MICAKIHPHFRPAVVMCRPNNFFLSLLPSSKPQHCFSEGTYDMPRVDIIKLFFVINLSIIISFVLLAVIN